MALSHSTQPAERSLLRTDTALCAWVGQAAPGDTRAYHEGFLAWDLSPQLSTLSRARRTALARLADCARELSEKGLVHLVQRREGLGHYSYLVIVRLRPQRTRGVRQHWLDQAAARAELVQPRDEAAPSPLVPAMCGGRAA